jgi:hypothetical protein
VYNSPSACAEASAINIGNTLGVALDAPMGFDQPKEHHMARVSTLLVGSAVAALLVIAGCGGGSYSAVRPVATPASGAMGGRPGYQLPMTVPGRSTQVIPFVMEEERKGHFNDDAYNRDGVYRRLSMESYSYRGYTTNVRWNNAAIRDLQSSREAMVLPTRGVIIRWGALTKVVSPDAPAQTQALVFIATTKDTNGNGFLDSLDGCVAYVTGPDGFGAVPVTPEDGAITAVDYTPETNSVSFLVAMDTDRDRKFTELDSPIPYTMILGSPPAKPALSEATLRKLEAISK